MEQALVVLVSAAVAVFAVPAAQFAWNWWQAPLQLLSDDVVALGTKLDQFRQELSQPASAADDAAKEREEERLRELRVAIARISEELEFNWSVLATTSRSFFETDLLAVGRWTEHGHVLADHGHIQAHRAARSAYRLMGEVNRSVNRHYEDDYVGGDVIAVFLHEEKAREALEASQHALSVLEAVPMGTEGR